MSMRKITAPDGTEIMVPARVNGKDLMKQLQVPPTKQLYRGKDGVYSEIRPRDKVVIKEGDVLQSHSRFVNGY